jgi:hypothetical protein
MRSGDTIARRGIDVVHQTRIPGGEFESGGRLEHCPAGLLVLSKTKRLVLSCNFAVPGPRRKISGPWLRCGKPIVAALCPDRVKGAYCSVGRVS